jgi:hypothetical protein
VLLLLLPLCLLRAAAGSCSSGGSPLDMGSVLTTAIDFFEVPVLLLVVLMSCLCIGLFHAGPARFETYDVTLV